MRVAILDELNGLSLPGKLPWSLAERGQWAHTEQNAEFGSQYELASYLHNYLSNFKSRGHRAAHRQY